MIASQSDQKGSPPLKFFKIASAMDSDSSEIKIKSADSDIEFLVENNCDHIRSSHRPKRIGVNPGSRTNKHTSCKGRQQPVLDWYCKRYKFNGHGDYQHSKQAIKKEPAAEKNPTGNKQQYIQKKVPYTDGQSPKYVLDQQTKS